MDYHAHYIRLIDRARDRQLIGYFERHHVLPKCLGGDNSALNMVRLTAEEHYVAHLLLVKMYPGNHRLLWAASCMTGANRHHKGRRNKLYGWLRRQFAKSVGNRSRGRPVSTETRAKQSAARLGRQLGPTSAETKAKMSAAAKGKTKSPEHMAAIRAAKIGKTRGPHTAATRAKIAESNRRAAKTRSRDAYRTPEYRALQSLKATQAWARRLAPE